MTISLTDYWLTDYLGKRLARDVGMFSLVASGSGSSGAWMKQVRSCTQKGMAARNVCSLREEGGHKVIARSYTAGEA